MPEPMPLVEAQESYSTELEGAPAPTAPWWEVFDDPVLNDLVETALNQNLTLAQAVERIVQAETFLQQARALRRPSVDAGVTVERQWERERPKVDGPDLYERIDDAAETTAEILSSLESLLSPLEPGTNGTTSPSGGGSSGQEDVGWQNRYDTSVSPSLTLRWEADLWGRLRSDVLAEREEVAAVEWDYEALRLMLTGQVAEAYFQAVEQRLQHALLLEQQELAGTYLELLELRFLQGSASIVDVLQQRGQLADVNAEVPVVLSQLGLLEHRLDVLLGEAPDGVDRTAMEAALLPTETALPRVGVPVALLENRPDLRALQRAVVASDYRIATAVAERLPRLTLDGTFLFRDTSSSASWAASGAASLFQPLLDWGLRRAGVTAARSRFRESLLAYTAGYLLAIEEVESALWREARQRELLEALALRKDIVEQTLIEARVRYSLGVTDYLPVLTAIQDLQDVQRELLRERRQLVLLRVELHRAIGGAVSVPDSLTEARAAHRVDRQGQDPW